MNCLKDYIGVRNCGQDNPESGLFINDLPGISLKVLDNIANDEQVTFLNVWNAVQARATQRINTAVTNYFGKRYRIKKLAQTTVLPKVYDANEVTPAEDEYRGFAVSIAEECFTSNLQVIHIQELSLYLLEASEVTFKVYDITKGIFTEIWTKTVELEAGWNKIVVNENFYESETIFVGYNAEEIDSVELKLDTSEDCDCYGVCFCSPNCGMEIRGAVFGQGIVYPNNTFGLAGVVSVKCMYESLVCNNKSLFATALWYLLGAEIMNERMYSDRLNRYTTIDLSKAKDLRTEFENIFINELNTAIEGIDISFHDCCIECNQVLTKQEIRP